MLKGLRGKEEVSAHGHAQQPSSIMPELEVLVCEGFGAVYTSTAGTIAEDEVAALDHEVFDLTICQQWPDVESQLVRCSLTTRWNLLPLYPCGSP